MNFQKLKSERYRPNKKDLEIDINENLNINNEINFKTSSKVLNILLSNHLNTDSNIKNNRNDMLRATINTNKDKKSYTKKELRKTMSCYFRTKRASVKNFRDISPDFSSSRKKEGIINSVGFGNIYEDKKQDKKKNYIEYNDLYFEDDMFIPESSSFPNEQEEDFLLKLQFIEENDYNDDIVDYNTRFNSISYKINHKDNIHLKYFSKNNESIYENKTSNSFKINNLYFDEKEEKGKNILYSDTLKISPNIKNVPKKVISPITMNKTNNNTNNNIISKIENYEPNISYISLNLLIKKIALENFRTKQSILYTCFMQQFKYFIPINIFIEKIILAYSYYNKSLNLNSSELVNLLNEVIMKTYDELKEDKNLIGNIQIFYLKIKNTKFELEKVNQDLNKINNLLFKNLKNDIGNTNKINDKTKKIKESSKDNIFDMGRKYKAKSFFFKPNKAIEEKTKKNKYNYFYIFDYKKEEIASYLTKECYNLMSNITEDELFNKNFNGNTKYKTAPNVTKMIERFDKLILFIIEDISSYDHKSERVEIIEKWIRIALACKDLKNYNDLIMINSLFSNYLLNKKMKMTWQKLSKKHLNYIEKIKNFCSVNQCYINIRREIFKCKGPYIPYLGILLKEIMTAEEMKYSINNNINILKLVKLSKIISVFFKFKNYEYSFDKFKNIEILSNVNPKNEEEIETIIKQLEPNLNIHAKKGDKKRITQSDALFYNKTKI